MDLCREGNQESQELEKLLNVETPTACGDKHWGGLGDQHGGSESRTSLDAQMELRVEPDSGEEFSQAPVRSSAGSGEEFSFWRFSSR